MGHSHGEQYRHYTEHTKKIIIKNVVDDLVKMIQNGGIVEIEIKNELKKNRFPGEDPFTGLKEIYIKLKP